MDVASIRSFILREASQDLPTPVERANAQAVEGQGVVAQSSLSAANGVQAQIIATQLDGDPSAAVASVSIADAANQYSVALFQDADERVNGSVDLTA